MKRHQSRLAPTVLTLSLLGAASLLTACGGGGGGGGEPAAAAPSTTASEPTIISETAVDEAYIVGPSNFITEFSAKYQLNILTGVDAAAAPASSASGATAAPTQVVVKTIAFDEPLDNRWLVVNKLDRTKPEAEVDLGGHTLFYIQKVGDDRQVFKMDLSKSVGALTPIRISAVSDACAFADSYAINKDGTATAFVLKTSGADKRCNTADDSKAIISSADSTAQAGRISQVTPTDTVLAPLYRAGGLLGFLIQRGVGSVAHLDIISPLQDSVLFDRVPFAAKDSSVVATEFGIDVTRPHFGAEWIADEPGETGNGYMRIQSLPKTEPDGNGGTKTTVANRLYRLEWNAAATPVTARLTGEEYPLFGGSLSNKGITDGDRIYIPSGPYVVHGPDTTPGAESRFSLLGVIGGNTITKAPITQLHVTPKQLVMIQKNGDRTSVYSMNKTTGVDITPIAELPNLEIFGIKSQYDANDVYKTSYLFAANKLEGNAHQRLLRYDLGAQEGKAYAEPLLAQARVIAPIWNKTRQNGQTELSELLLCTPTSVYSENCANESLRTFDLLSAVNAPEPFKITLGNLIADDAESIKVTAPKSFAGRNTALFVDKVVAGGVKTRQDVWMFHPSVNKSLKPIKTITTSTPTTTP